MARTHGPKSVVCNNYITIPLISREDVPESTVARTDRICMPAPFRVSSVSYDMRGLTGTVTGSITAWNKASVKAVHNPVTISGGGNPFRIGTGNAAMRQGFMQEPNVSHARNIADHDRLDFRIATEAASTATAGKVMAWVTGYFKGPVVPRTAKFSESGILGGERPLTGYYDLIKLVNLEEVGSDTAEATFCTWVCPYGAARVMAVYLDIRGATEVANAITSTVNIGGVYGSGTKLFNAVDMDVADENRIDKDSGWYQSVRDIVRGDFLEQRISTGVDDVVPVGCLTTHLLIWVQDHVRDLNDASDAVVED